jgi:hypothetical protein
VSSRGLLLLQAFAAIAEIAQASDCCLLGLTFCSACAGPSSHREGQNYPETPTSVATNLDTPGELGLCPFVRIQWFSPMVKL